jgi:hypothetical protein
MTITRKQFQWIADEKELRAKLEEFRKKLEKALKGDGFAGLVSEYEAVVEDAVLPPDDRKEVAFNVQDYLREYMMLALKPVIDLDLTKAVGNMNATADLVVDGVIFRKNAPVSWLLETEGRLRIERELMRLAPFLDLTKKWEDTGDGKVWKYGPVITNREAKKTSPLVLYPATHEFPAQVKEVTDIRLVAKNKKTVFSSALHPADKSKKLARFDKLIAALKHARLKANDIEVEGQTVADKMIDYVLDGTLPEALPIDE